MLLEDVEKNSAFCVPAKQEQRKPPRRHTHMIAASRLLVPVRKTMAREDDEGSPTTCAVTGRRRLRTDSEDGIPQARCTHGTNASWM